MRLFNLNITKKIALFLFLAIVFTIVIIYLSLSISGEEAQPYSFVAVENSNNQDFKGHSHIKIAANTYYEANEFKKMIQGEHYREAWSTPVIAPIVYLDTLRGGMEIIKEGGGKQTKSLRLKGKDGYTYTLRSIKKDPSPLIPEYAKLLKIENVILDGISAQHPYAASVVAVLAHSVGLLSTQPQLVFVPEQPTLDIYNDEYGNQLYWLEYESEGEKNWTEYKDVLEILDTKDLQQLKDDKGATLQVNRELLIRARLFDMIIGDWDRHYKQWGWVIQKKDNMLNAIPLPADRDNAFFETEGLVPNIISSRNIQPKLRPFSEDIDYMPGLVHEFDRYFLLNTSESEFITQANYLKDNLTDEVIMEAMNVWPKEIYELNGKEIVSKLKSRRDKIEEFAIEFYYVIQEANKLDTPLNKEDELSIREALKYCFDCED